MVRVKDRNAIFWENLHTIKEGALIRFVRYGSTFFGIVTAIREKTAMVIVDSNKHSMGMYFDAERDVTIVNHANYDIVTLEPSKYITDLDSQYLYARVSS